MTSKLREYHRPAEMAEALALLQRAGVRVTPLVAGPRVPDEPWADIEAVMDLGRLGLSYITETQDCLVHLGAATPVQHLVDSVLLQSMADGIVSEAALLSGGSAMRNAARVGGAILEARQAAASLTREGPPELLAALLVLQSEVVFMRGGQGQWAVDLGEYLASGGGVTGGDLLVECRFAHTTGGAHAALARVARTPRDQSIVAAVALIDAGTLRLALAAGGEAPQRLAVEQAFTRPPWPDALLDRLAREAEAAVAPRPDFRGSAEYRRAMAGVLARRALAQAARRASE